MVDKRSRYASSTRDRPSSITNESARNSQQNFITEFLKYSEEYDVEPLPKLVTKSAMDVRFLSSFSRLPTKSDIEEAPTFYVMYENRKLDTPKRVESKGCEVTICILDALNTTMQKYNTITVLKLPDCRINAFGIVQIADMLTNIGCLRDLNLDMNPNTQENYHLLCKPAGNLHYLSLKLCQISDNGIKKIANELRYQDPPNDPKLIILDLTNNHITKDGAGHISSMLRTNRSLSSLILLGNRICDEGASLIIRELKIITLMHEEIVNLRRRKFAELMLHDKLMEKRDSEEPNKPTEEQPLKRNTKSRSIQNLRRSRKSLQDFSIKSKEEGLNSHSQEAEAMLEGKKRHPLQNESFPVNGYIIATGNLDLQYLDLSYNYLTKNILKELIECIHYQMYMLLGNISRGLLHVLLEGEGIEKEDNKDWSKFEELLNMKRSNDPLTDDIFREFVSEDSEILRKNIKIN